MTHQIPVQAPTESLASDSTFSTKSCDRQSRGLRRKACSAMCRLRVVIAVCGVLLSGCFAASSLAQQINYSTFSGPQTAPSSPFSNACPAGVNILFCANYTGTAPSFIQDSYPAIIDPNAANDGGAGATYYALQLNPNLGGQSASIWSSIPQDVVDGFTTWFAFKINYQGGGDGNTADGMAFVIQNALGGKTDSISTCPETGSGPSVLGFGGGCLGYGGIDNSVALEMDTFYSSWDPQQRSRTTDFSDNHFALQSCGLDGNGTPFANSPTHTTTPNCLLSLGGASTLITSPVTSVVAPATGSAVLISDGSPHQVVMVYNGPNESPANYLWVYLDAAYNAGTHTPVAGSVPMFSGPFDITKYMKLSNGGGRYSPAYVGFTAATGGDYEQHEVMGWTYTPHFNQPNFGSVNVCPLGQGTPAPCSETFSYTYTLPNGAMQASVQVVTEGISGLDFTLSSTTCTGAISAGTSCTVNVTFSPLAPGLRLGAINVLNNGAIFATTLISGVGEGPAAAVAPGTQSPVGTLGTSLAQPRGIVVDAAGDLYISDRQNQRVLEVAPNGTVSTISSGLSRPNGLALDGAGNLFVAVSNSNTSSVVKVPVGCASPSCQSTVGFGLSQVGGVAVDGAGDVFLNDDVNYDIVEVPAGCASSACQTVVYGPSPGSSPGNIVVDAAGDLFVPDPGLQKVIEVPAGCLAASCQVQIGQGWITPISAAVDAAGDVFVTDLSLTSVIEVPAGCASSTCQSTVVTGINPYGVAVDGQGDIFVSDVLYNQVVEVNRSQTQTLNFPTTFLGNTNTASVTLQNIGNQTLQAESPGLLTVSGASYGNTPGPGAPADCSSVSSLAPGISCNVSVIFSPLSYTQPNTGSVTFADNSFNATNTTQTVSLFGFGAKPVQNFYQVTVAEPGTGSGIVTDVSGAINCTGTNGIISGSCLASLPGSSAITFTATASGTSIFQGWGGACASAGTNSSCSVLLSQATTIIANFVNPSFGNVNVCPAGQSGPAPCSATLPVTYNFPTTTTIGAIKVVTQGATGLDFTLGSGSSCVGSVAGGSSCNVTVNFAPLAPGLRTGAVELFDNAGNAVATTPLSGVGESPEIAFGPGIQSTVPVTGLHYNVGVAVDAAGNTFVADYTAGKVVKFTPGGVQTTVPTSGLTAPVGVAVDGAGNVYITDLYFPSVVKVTPSGIQTTLGSGLNYAIGIALDAAGDVFVGDQNNNRVVEITPSGGQTTVPFTGINQPWGVAVDAQGDVFVADGGHSRVVEITPGGVQTTVPTTGLSQPYDLAVDAAGDVYIADPANARVVEVPASGGTQTTVGTGLNYPSGVTVDGAGDVLIGDQGSGQVVKIVRSQPPLLGFAQTNLGGTSVDSPQSVSVQNIGNRPLTGSVAFNLGGNFTQNATPDCSAQLPLAPGASCMDSFSFTPQSATFLSGTAIFSDNNLNGSLTTQTITLSGTGATNGVAGLVTVPNVVGQIQTAATVPITGAGLAMGTVSTASSQTVPSGTVISQSPAATTQVAVGTAVNLLVSSGIPLPSAANPLSLENNYFVTGDYAAASVGLRGMGRNGSATGSIVMPSYSPSTTLGVPAGADVVDAFLYWETLENTASASSTNGTFNNYPIVGQQIGNDLPNYVDGQFTGTIRVYRASVNAYLPVGAGGIRIVSGTYTVSLPDGGTALPLTEGASLVMVYRVLSPNFPLKSVILYDGSATSTVVGTQIVQGFYDAAGGANGTGKSTNIFASGGSWNSGTSTVTLGQSNQYSAPLNAGAAYAAVILSTPVNNSDNDGILDAWKVGPGAGDFHAGQPGYYDVKTGTWVGLPGAKHGQKDLFVQLDYMCSTVLASGSCDPAGENLFPAPDANGNDPLVMVQKAFASSGVQLHLQIGNAVPEDTCVDGTATQLCQFPGQSGVVGWKNSLEFSKLYPRNLGACLTGGDCTTRFPYGQKDSYHYVLMGHSLAIPAWNTRYGTLTSINVVNGVTTIGTVDRGVGTINACPSRITLAGVLGDPSLNGVYNTTGCADTKTITIATPGVPNFTYPNSTLPEPVIGLTSGTISSISGYSDLGGADSAVTLGLWLTAKNQDMSKKANVLAGTIFHEIGHTLGLSHGGLYYDTAGSYVPTFDANCKPNYQSIMNYLFQLDGVGPNAAVAFSNQTLNPVNESSAGSVTQLTDGLGNAATFPTSAWYVPYTTGSPVTPATRHCDGTPLIGDSAYRVDAPIAPIAPPWTNGQDLNFIGTLQTNERGFNDLANMDLRQVGATGGEFASLASVLSFGSSVAPLNISAGGNVTLGSGGTVALGSGGNVTLGSGGNVTLGSGGTITLGSGGNVTLGSGGNVTLGSGGTVTPGSSGNVTLGSGGNVTLGSGGTITLGSGGTVTIPPGGSGGNVTLGSGGTITLGSGGVVTIPAAGGSYPIDSNGGTITLGSGGNVTLGSGGNVTLGSGGTITLGSGGNVTLGSGGNVTLGSGGTITLGSGGNVTLGSGGNVTLGSGGTITLGSGGNVTLGSGGNVTLGSGGTVTLGSGGNVTLGSGGNVTLGSGGSATLGAGGTVTLGSGGNVTLGSGGNVTLGSGGTITLGSGGNVTLGSGGNVTLGSGGNITLGSGGTLLVAAGGNVTLGSGGTITLGSGGAAIPIGAGGSYSFNGGVGGTITLGSGGNVTLGSGGNVTLGSGGNITLGSGGNITLGSGGNVTLGSGGNITLGSGGTITLGSGGNVTLGSGGVVTLGNGGSVTPGDGESSFGLASVSNITPPSGGPQSNNELTYETANSVVRPPSLPVKTATPAGVRITWQAPAFGVVQTYVIYRSSDGATPIIIGSVSGINGNAPATEFTDTNPDVTAKVVVYTISTVLVPDTSGSSRQSPPSPPAVIKNDQSIVLGPLPSSATLANSPTVTATALSSGVPNGLQVVFSATGPCAIGMQSIASNVSSAAVTLSGIGSCTVTASQPGTSAFNAANSVSGTFMVLANGSAIKPQTINFPAIANAQYGNSFTFSATSSAGLPVNFTATGPCMTNGSISGVGVCKITASSVGNSSYSAASLTQSFNIYPAVLKVTANNVASIFGQPLAALTYSYSGFVNSDPPTVVVGGPGLSTTATSTSNVGNYPITVSTGTLAATNYSFLYVNGTLTVQPANQAALTLIATSPLVFGQSETLSTTGGSSGGIVTYNLAGGTCTLNGAILTANSGTGTCLVTATMAAGTNYNAVTSTPATSVTLAPASQTITFTTTPPLSAAYNSTFMVAATGASGGTATFTSAGACSVSGSTYKMTSGVGTCSVIANLAGNANYSAAPSVTKSVAATLAVPTVTFTGAPLSAAYRSGFVLSSTTNASTTAAITSSGACSNVGTAVTMTSGTGTCSLTATWAADNNYSAATAHQSTTASKIAPTVTFTGAPANAVYRSLFTVATTTNASSAASIASSGACSNVGTAVTMTSGTGSCSLTATWVADSNYSAATATQTTTATLAAQSITFTTNPPATAAYNSTFTVAATGGGSGNAVIFTSAGVCSNSGATYTMSNSTGSCSVIANQAGNSNYAAAAPVTKTVGATGPLLSVSPSSINFGTVYQGSISAQTITVTNTGSAAATITDPLLSIVKGGNSNEFVALSVCPKSLAAGKSCTVLIGFIAGPYYTPQTATLQIMSNAPGSPQPVALSALVINPAATLSTTSLSFGTIKHATSSTMNVTLSNTGGTSLSLTSIGVAGANAASFAQTSNCGTLLAAGSSCTIAVKFTPPAAGTFGANLVIVDNAQAGGGTQTVALSGKGS